MFLEAHYARLQRALEFFHLSVELEEIQKNVQRALAEKQMQTGRKVLKVAVSQKHYSEYKRK